MKSDSEDKELETGTGEFVNADDAAEKEEQLPLPRVYGSPSMGML